MIPGISIKVANSRTVAMISECEGSYIVEPMRFLWPSEAKKEQHSARPYLLAHNTKSDPLRRAK